MQFLSLVLFLKCFYEHINSFLLQTKLLTLNRFPWRLKALRKAAGRIVTSLWAKSLP